MIAAYPGFKSHKPRPAAQPSEENCCATARAMVRELMNHFKIAPEHIVLFGESLSIMRIGCIALIVFGILGLKILGGESAA